MRFSVALAIALVGASCALAGSGASRSSGTAAVPMSSQRISPQDLARLAEQHGKMLIIDVRDPAEFARETIRGAINVPLPELQSRLGDIPKDTTLVFT